jgi:glycosyltransferase involved in cell wall biosynthesis
MTVKMQRFLSIIVPVYKVEQYLPQCIESVLQQGFKDLELILVDDGSPDNCPQLCDEYALRDDRIMVIHKKNGGLSDARNAGMERCNGKYIAFLDGDDYLTNDCLLKAYDRLMGGNQPDLLMGTFVALFVKGDREINKFKLTEMGEKIDDYKEMLVALLKENAEIPWAAWRNIYKVEIINNYDLKFEKNLVGAEDCTFFMEYIKHIKSFTIMEDPLVNYRVSRTGSITNLIKYSVIIGQLKVFSKYGHEYCGELTNERLICSHFAEKFANTVSTLYFLTVRDEINAAVKLVTANQAILKHARGKKYAVARFFWRVFGYYHGSCLMNKVRT